MKNSMMGGGMTGPLSSSATSNIANGITGLSSYQSMVYTIIQVSDSFVIVIKQVKTMETNACYGF